MGGGGGGGGEERVAAHPGCGPGGMVGLCFHSLTARCSQMGGNRELITHTRAVGGLAPMQPTGFILNLGTVTILPGSARC